MTILYIIIALVILAVVWTVMVYNKFIRLRNQAEEAWADIDVQLKRRYDLIPNLIETVKGYAGHEKDVLESVTNARAAAMQAEQSGDPQQAAEAENMLSGTLKTLFALSESYPDLKANANFLELQRELSDTENKIQASRRFYNSNVRDMNIGVESFPGNIIAGMFGFGKMDLFDLEDNPEQKENVEVKF